MTALSKGNSNVFVCDVAARTDSKVKNEFGVWMSVLNCLIDFPIPVYGE
ncbi:MAG: hypothetical protein Ct9H300mP14_02750 [Gammaproteobacteria bacterium]|nr:MAG: hypothetical protein Ct9H300mP14_02750 [Gammaproteobacteria bacterium]